jgi:hypothetical protein
MGILDSETLLFVIGCVVAAVLIICPVLEDARP